MAWPHSVASVIVKLPREKGFGIAVGGRPRLRLLRKPALDAIPRLKVDDRAVQAVVNLPLVAKPSHAGGGVESLGHRDERDVVFVEQLDDLGEVGQRPCQPVDLVNYNHVDLSSANVL